MSLTHGFFIVTLQAVVGVALLAVIGRRSRRWLMLWLPIAVAMGVALVAASYWYIGYQGWSQDPAPVTLWLWIALAGVAVVLAVAGWRGTGWWRRGGSVLVIALCVLCVALSVNIWVGYFPTVKSAWDTATGNEPPRWVDRSTVAEMQRDGVRPTQGVVVKVTTPDAASGFLHRQELVYLPPAWFETTPPPPLPAVMMFSGEFGRPDDWLRGADLLKTLDEFTAKHRGNAPVMVFPDVWGQFNNDTECVNGPRGNSADHLTKDLVPFVVSTFGVSSKAANWGVAGWSSGGTCALMLAALHPELFSALVDIDGQLGPNAGTLEQTTARLFGGDSAAWAAFDPKTIISQHGRYTGMAAWFGVSSDTSPVYRAGALGASEPVPPSNWDTNSEDHAAIAHMACLLVSTKGIECAVVSTRASHDFAGAGRAFATALPWLAGRLGTPGVNQIPLPGAPGS